MHALLVLSESSVSPVRDSLLNENVLEENHSCYSLTKGIKGRIVVAHTYPYGCGCGTIEEDNFSMLTDCAVHTAHCTVVQPDSLSL